MPEANLQTSIDPTRDAPAPTGQRWRLSETQLASYRADGLVRPRLRLDDAAVETMRDLLDRTLQATPGRRPESLVCPHIEEMNGIPASIAAEWLSVCTDPQLLDVVSQVIGPDVILWGSQLFCKPAGTGLPVPWHQDGHFWPIRPLATCTVWLAIDEVDAANSAMEYVPGSHRSRHLFEHVPTEGEEQVLNAEVAAGSFDLGLAQVDELRAGEFSLHDVFLIHGSKPNRSNRRRAGFVIRYMPATSHYDRELATAGSRLFDARLRDRPLFLVRGEDWTGKTGLVEMRS